MTHTKVLSVGVEPEGHIAESYIVDGEFHHDGSVTVDGSGECDGDCRNNCECANYCECEECIRCEICSASTYDCTCDSCHYCSECNESSDCCECDQMHFQMTGDNKCAECTRIGATCDDCHELYVDEYHTFNCSEAGNSYNGCDFDCGCECECECDCGSDGKDGEAVSIPMPETEMEDWLNKNEDAILRTNNTCGMHIHVGNLTHREYGVLMHPDFHEFLKEELIAWGVRENIREGSAFWKRLNGDNTYCKDDYRADEQKLDTTKSGQRYCFVNYCWKLHGTVEVRILPCFQKPELRVKGFKEVLRIIHAYLSNNKPRIHRLELKEVIN